MDGTLFFVCVFLLQFFFRTFSFARQYCSLISLLQYLPFLFSQCHATVLLQSLFCSATTNGRSPLFVSATEKTVCFLLKLSTSFPAIVSHLLLSPLRPAYTHLRLCNACQAVPDNLLLAVMSDNCTFPVRFRIAPPWNETLYLQNSRCFL